MIQLELTTNCHGMDWHLYAVEFDSPDGKFSTYLYAISDLHAQLQVEALRETAVVSGKLEGITPAGKGGAK